MSCVTILPLLKRQYHWLLAGTSPHPVPSYRLSMAVVPRWTPLWVAAIDECAGRVLGDPDHHAWEMAPQAWNRKYAMDFMFRFFVWLAFGGTKMPLTKINSNIKTGRNRETAQLMASPRCWRCTHFEVLKSKTTSYVLRKRSFIMSRHRNLALPTWRNLNQLKPDIISCGQDGFSRCYSPS